MKIDIIVITTCLLIVFATRVCAYTNRVHWIKLQREEINKQIQAIKSIGVASLQIDANREASFAGSIPASGMSYRVHSINTGQSDTIAIIIEHK